MNNKHLAFGERSITEDLLNKGEKILLHDGNISLEILDTLRKGI